MDGSLADSIPVKRAFAVGCDRVVCILTRKPEEAPTNYGKMRVLMRTYKKKYPAFYDTLMRRREMYAKQLDRIDRYPSLLALTEQAAQKKIPVYLTGISAESTDYDSKAVYESLGIIPLPEYSPLVAYMYLWYKYSQKR